MSDLTSEELDEGERLLTAATPRPWSEHRCAPRGPNGERIDEWNDSNAEAIVWAMNNAPALIAAARVGLERKTLAEDIAAQNDVVRLKAERDALTTELEALKDKYIRRCQTCHEPNPCGSMQVFGYCNSD